MSFKLTDPIPIIVFFVQLVDVDFCVIPTSKYHLVGLKKHNRMKSSMNRTHLEQRFRNCHIPHRQVIYTSHTSQFQVVHLNNIHDRPRNVIDRLRGFLDLKVPKMQTPLLISRLLTMLANASPGPYVPLFQKN